MHSTSAATLPVYGVALYFTFSRGAMLAAMLGFAALVAVDPRRVQSVTYCAVLGVPTAVAVYFSIRADALTHVGSPLAVASHQGRTLAWVLLGCALASSLLCAGLAVSERRWTWPSTILRLYSMFLLAAGAVAVVVALYLAGSPIGAARRAWSDFQTPKPPATANLNARLFSASGNERFDLEERGE